MTDQVKLQNWKKILNQDENRYTSQSTFDERERLFQGLERDILPITEEKAMHRAKFLYNIVRENIESMIDTNIPMPKVTAKRPGDEKLALLIENFLRNELDRMPFGAFNDQQERTVRIQGGSHWFVEFDSRIEGHDTIGDLVITPQHPKRVIPQAGVFDGIQAMDHIFLTIPRTKKSLKEEYGVDLTDKNDDTADVKSPNDTRNNVDLITQKIVYYRDEKGRICRYSWAGDEELEDLVDCQARRLKRCKTCGTPGNGGTCPECGGTKWVESPEDYEERYVGYVSKHGNVIPGVEMVEGIAVPTKIPLYRPDCFPVVLQKNVSLYGEYLGASDVDAIADIQNGVNRMSKKIFDRLLKAGTKITLPNDTAIKIDEDDSGIIILDNAADKAMIDVYQFSGNLQYEMSWFSQLYEMARNELGITDSYQGRKDSTATSGTAKQFAAAQSAGRLESQKVMKQSAYAELFEMMFKFALAYMDEPRRVVFTNQNGETEYDDFDRYDFLMRDEDGSFWWNDEFLFSCDESSGLAQNRTGMWQEITSQFQAGCFGNPTDFETIVTYWSLMERHHYPGAGDNRRIMQERLMRQQEQTAAAQSQQAALLQQRQQIQEQQSQMQMQKEEAELRKTQQELLRGDKELRQSEGTKNGSVLDAFIG